MFRVLKLLSYYFIKEKKGKLNPINFLEQNDANYWYTRKIDWIFRLKKYFPITHQARIPQKQTEHVNPSLSYTNHPLPDYFGNPQDNSRPYIFYLAAVSSALFPRFRRITCSKVFLSLRLVIVENMCQRSLSYSFFHV